MATSDDSGLYIGTSTTTDPEDTDAPSKGAAEIRQVKIQAKNTFPNCTGAVTSSHTELNYLNGSTPGTAVASKALVVDANKDINLGTGDLTATLLTGAHNGTVGATTPAAGTFTTLTANTSITMVNAITEFSTDGTLAGDSDSALPTEKAVKTYVDGLSLVPAGAVMAFAMATAPSGWLECDGSAVSRTTYAALFTAIGTLYGAGDTTTTFNLPDLRGEFIRGWDHGKGTDPDAATRTDSGGGTTGDNVGTKQADAFKSHTHGYTKPLYTISRGSGSELASVSSQSATVGLSGGSETRPVNVYMMYCIKT